MPFHVMARKDSRIPARDNEIFHRLPQRLDPTHLDPLVGHTSTTVMDRIAAIGQH